MFFNWTMAFSNQSILKRLILPLKAPFLSVCPPGLQPQHSLSRLLVTCELVQEKKIAIVSLNDPEKLNALSVPIGEELNKTIGLLKQEPDLRAVILTGKGKNLVQYPMFMHD